MLPMIPMSLCLYEIVIISIKIKQILFHKAVVVQYQIQRGKALF